MTNGAPIPPPPKFAELTVAALNQRRNPKPSSAYRASLESRSPGPFIGPLRDCGIRTPESHLALLAVEAGGAWLLDEFVLSR